MERLAQQHGWGVKLPDLLVALTVDCSERGSTSIYDRCKAVYERCMIIGAQPYVLLDQ